MSQGPDLLGPEEELSFAIRIKKEWGLGSLYFKALCIDAPQVTSAGIGRPSQ